MKKLLIFLLLIPFLASAQTTPITPTFRINTPVNSKDSVAYFYTGKIGGYSWLYNAEYLRTNFAPITGGGYIPNTRSVLNGYGILGGTQLNVDITKSVDTSVIVSKTFAGRYLTRSSTAELTNKTFPTAPTANDMPLTYQYGIRNQTGQQSSANFNIDGYGKATKYFYIPNSTDENTGTIRQGVTTLIHNYAHATSDGGNLFVGPYSGNFTMSPGGGLAELASRNTALGFGTFGSNTTGYNNTALGWGALNGNTTGYTHVAVGTNALNANTTGFGSTAIGNFALRLNTTGNLNTAVGEGALRFKETGDEVVAVGHGAGYYDVNGSRNVYLGWTTGPVSFLTTVNDVIALGYGATNTASNQSVLGGSNIQETFFGSTSALSKIFGKNSTMTSLVATLPSYNAVNNAGSADQYYHNMGTGAIDFGRFKRPQTGSYANFLELDTYAGHVLNLNSLGGSSGSYKIASNGTDISTLTSAGALNIAGGFSTTGVTVRDDNAKSFVIGRYSAGIPISYIKAGSNSTSGLRISNYNDTQDMLAFDGSGDADFIGTVSGDDAVAVNDFVTKQQMDAAVAMSSGTWTPASATVTLTVNFTYYQTVGKMTTAFFNIDFPVSASGSQVAITGLPGAPYNGYPLSISINDSGINIYGETQTTSSTLLLTDNTHTAITYLQMSGKKLAGSVTYRIP